MWLTFDDCEAEAPERAQGPAADLLSFVRRRLGIEPDERQREMLESTAKRGILNCSRQWGKSTMAAAKAVHRAYTVPECLVVVASPTDRQSAELVRKAGKMTEKLGLPWRGDGDNRTSLEFPNGSRIVGLPGGDGRVRGFSAVSLLLIDEAARVPDDLYTALRPMLAVSGGDLWLMSTPWGRRGFFYNAWQHGGDEWTRWSVPATECPRIPKKFLEEEHRSHGTFFAQEYLCTFMDNETSLFDRDRVEEAIDHRVEPLDFGTWDEV